ncbi:hypothetical protein ASC80_12215 [Afipia sp. Root123D2]|nr:hypothetical protein ASC80_12215 [Afipia sp. Root123D2]
MSESHQVLKKLGSCTACFLPAFPADQGARRSTQRESDFRHATVLACVFFEKSIALSVPLFVTDHFVRIHSQRLGCVTRMTAPDARSEAHSGGQFFKMDWSLTGSATVGWRLLIE